MSTTQPPLSTESSLSIEASPELDEAAPSRIGSWQLVSLVGEGSWTRVYRARPASCGPEWPADYAVKMLKPSRARDHVAVRLLQREDVVGRQVTHPHLAPILSSRVDRPPFYLVLPLLSGVTLAEYIGSESPLPPPMALWIARQATDALWALHRHGWLHGDVKPSNLYLSPTGHVTLIDLGFARKTTLTIDPHAVPLEALPATSTPAYAAPEFFRPSNTTDPRGDTYSLGVTLFEMLTGQRPFGESDPERLAVAHCDTPAPDIRDFQPNLPRNVAQLVRRLLAKDPHDRPDDADLIDWLVNLEIATFHIRARSAA